MHSSHKNSHIFCWCWTPPRSPWNSTSLCKWAALFLCRTEERPGWRGVSVHPRGACRADPRMFWQDYVSNLGQKTFVSSEDLGSYSQRLLKEISLFSVKMVDAATTVIVIPLKSSLIWQNDPKKEWQSQNRQKSSVAVGTAQRGRGKFGPRSWQKGRGRLGSFPDKSMHHSLLLMQKRWQNEALVHAA